MVQRSTGRGPAAPVTALMVRLWGLFPSPLSELLETCMRQWMSSKRKAGVALLGKMEYHGPTFAQLVYFMEVIQSEARRPSATVSDEAVKTAMRSFDLRFAFGNSVTDHHVRQSQRATATGSDGRDALDAEDPEAQTVGRVLRQCQEDPITFTTLSKQMAHFRKPETPPLRRQLLQLAEVDLGVLQTQQRRAPGSAEPLTSLCRSQLTSTRRNLLRSLRVPEACSRPSRQEACASVVTPEPDAPMAPAAASAASEQLGETPRVTPSKTGASGQRLTSM